MTEKKNDKDKFENIAKELECDESDDALDKVIESLKVKVEPDQDSAEEK
tara:strand:+ start:1099 stop:1245 length:147 start_codon:yes stop_codon:yes gene_type:complete